MKVHSEYKENKVYKAEDGDKFTFMSSKPFMSSGNYPQPRIFVRYNGEKIVLQLTKGQVKNCDAHADLADRVCECKNYQYAFTNDKGEEIKGTAVGFRITKTKEEWKAYQDKKAGLEKKEGGLFDLNIAPESKFSAVEEKVIQVMVKNKSIFLQRFTETVLKDGKQVPFEFVLEANRTPGLAGTDTPRLIEIWEEIMSRIQKG